MNHCKLLPSEQSLIAVLRYALYGDTLAMPICSASELYDIAHRHAVLGMLSTLPHEIFSSMPEEIVDSIVVYTYHLEKAAKANNQFIAGMARTFDSLNIRYALLKGQSMAACYPNPNLRAVGDIDVYVVPCDFPKTIEVMYNHGFYKTEETMLHSSLRHPQGWNVELHHDLQHLQWPNHNKHLRHFTEQLFDNADPAHDAFITIDGTSVRVLPYSLDMLMLTIHTMSHVFCAGVGLRHISDWLMRQKTETKNGGQLLPDDLQLMLKQTGARQMWNVLATISRQQFGRNVPTIGTVSDYAYRHVFRWMMQSGNFSHGEQISFAAYYWRFLCHCVSYSPLAPKEALAWPIMKTWRAITNTAHKKN